MDQLFIGRLPQSCKTRELEDIFYKYGRMTRCDVKQGEYPWASPPLSPPLHVCSYIIVVFNYIFVPVTAGQGLKMCKFSSN